MVRVETMDITHYLDKSRLLPAVRASCKKQLLKDLSEQVEKNLFYKKQIVFDALNERERLGSTGIGGGVAIPHVRLVGLRDVVGYFVRLEQPIPFDAVDGEPVDLAFLLLAPAVSSYSNATHLKALASVSRLLRNKIVCARLRAEHDPAKLWQILLDASREQNTAAA